MGGIGFVIFQGHFFQILDFPFDLTFKCLCNTLKIFLSATPTSIITASVPILSLIFTTESPFWSMTLANESGKCVNIIVVKNLAASDLFVYTV